jgi:monothiol glutaredoxin
LTRGRLTAYRYLSQEAKTKIQKAIEAKPVVLFMKGTPDSPSCGFSRAVVQVLDLHGVPLEKMDTYNVLADADLRSAIKEYSCVFSSARSLATWQESSRVVDSEWPTIPQIYINGEFVGGCDILLGSTLCLSSYPD